MAHYPQIGESFLLSGPAGHLEVISSIENASQDSPVAIICHPHPLFGGTMNNKVVSTLARTCKDLGVRSVRFNFRGVGQSDGKFDNGEGELEDLLTVIAWVKKVAPATPLWLAGFSFGSYIAAKAAIALKDIQQLICVAPPVINFKMGKLAPIPCPWIVVQGEQDEIVSAEAVFAWVESQQNKPILIKIPEASHFFHGKLLLLREQLENVVNNAR